MSPFDRMAKVDPQVRGNIDLSRAPRDLPPIGFETRLPHFREGWRAAYLWHALLLAAAIGLILGALFGRFTVERAPQGGPLIKSEFSVACSVSRFLPTFGDDLRPAPRASAAFLWSAT